MTKLSVGMATFDDFHGVAFTVQSLRMVHGLHIHEILVVDNNPGSEHGRETKALCNSSRFVRYIEMPEQTGTTQPRERIFREATGDAVLVVDPHVLIVPGAIERLVKYYDEHPESLDLLSGPLLYDNLRDIETNFDEVWSAEMEGQWHRDPRGEDPDAEPFDIPGQGLGLFTCRREGWLGFNPHFRGFGGEELYIHRKYRKAGRRTLCLPFLRWWHRFGRPGGTPYPVPLYSKVRNYVLGHLELGMDVAPIWAHFWNKMPKNEWDWLLADPVAHDQPPSCRTCGGGKPPGGYGRPQPPAGANLKEIFEWSKQTPRDMERLHDTMLSFVEKCDHVTEFSKRRETTVVLLAGRPKTVISYQQEQDEIYEALHAAVAAEQQTLGDKTVQTFTTHVGDSLVVDPIAETDLLLIHNVHDGDRLLKELERHGPSVKRFIMCRSTGAYGEMSEDGNGPGLLAGLRAYMRLHPEWSVVYHTADQYGLTVLSRDARDKPQLPGKITMAFNLASAMAAHVADGFTKADEETVRSRLEQCSLCEQRVNDRCAACGCYLENKAVVRTSECPLGRWPVVQIESEGAAS